MKTVLAPNAPWPVKEEPPPAITVIAYRPKPNKKPAKQWAYQTEPPKHDFFSEAKQEIKKIGKEKKWNKMN